jgi:hypothetical protein
MASFIGLLLSFLTFSILSNAHNIQLKAHSRECFHENLHKDDQMIVTFQVGDREFGGSGNLDIDFWVRALPLCGKRRYEMACWQVQEQGFLGTKDGSSA